jgi:putative heme-binding domain-containing protein
MIQNHSLDDKLKAALATAAHEHPDAYVRSLFSELVPASQRPKRLQDSVSAAQILGLTGDALRGKQIFLQSSASQCKKCHQIHGSGGKLGPDLSMIGKKYGRESLLEMILQPSKAIAEEYIVHIAVTTDGHAIAGFLAEKTDDKIVLKDALGERHAIAPNEIESLTASPQSVMPDLILSEISAQDTADLLEYLTTLR